MFGRADQQMKLRRGVQRSRGSCDVRGRGADRESSRWRRAGLQGLQLFDGFAAHLVEHRAGANSEPSAVQSDVAEFVRGVAEAAELVAQSFDGRPVLRGVERLRESMVTDCGCFAQRPGVAQRLAFARVDVRC